jgi:hypothetical protein
MNRHHNRSSAFDAILAWGWPFVSPVEPAKTEQSTIAGAFPARTDMDLLLMRMEALHLDPSLMEAATPDAFRLLAHVCSYCQYKVRCEEDLVYEAAGKSVPWENYCPNAFRLKATPVSTSLLPLRPL